MTIEAVFGALWPLIVANGLVILALIVFAFLYPHRPNSEVVIKRYHPSFVGVFLREFAYWFYLPLFKLAIFFKLTPNMITSISLVLSLSSGICYYFGKIALGGWILGIASLLDMVDGQVARATNQVTREGAFYDSCIDRFNEGFLFIGIGLYYRNNALLLALIFFSLIGSQLVSYTKARGEAVGANTMRGLMQRAERLALFGLGSIFFPFIVLVMNNYNVDPQWFWVAIMGLMALLTNMTAIVRIVDVFKKIRSSNAN